MIGCRSKSDNLIKESLNSSEYVRESEAPYKVDEVEKRFRDSLYNRESDNYISKLEEIPDIDSNAYRLTISSKNSEKHFSKILNTRPKASLINYCNDYYTVVGFSCGGPCYSQVFIFTDERRPIEQYDYTQSVTGYPNIIAHTKNEEFEKLIVHNFDNDKEIVVDNPDINFMNYGQMDTMYIIGKELRIEYRTEKDKTRKKTISLQKILN